MATFDWTANFFHFIGIALVQVRHTPVLVGFVQTVKADDARVIHGMQPAILSRLLPMWTGRARPGRPRSPTYRRWLIWRPPAASGWPIRPCAIRAACRRVGARDSWASVPRVPVSGPCP